MTAPDPGASDSSDPVKPDLRKHSGSRKADPDEPKGPDAAKAGEPARDFGPTFDYDATAHASLSEQQSPSESFGGHIGTPGPGWDTYSGVGNGPGWGTTPSYPPPAEHQSDYPPPGNYPYPGSNPAGDSRTPGPVYGAPDPRYPTSVPGTPTPGTPSAPYGASPSSYGPPQGYGPQGPQGYGPQGYGTDLSAPFGRDPYTGEAYSEKSKVTAGVLQIVLGAFGAGRFYVGDPGTAVAQIAVTWLTCGIGGIWPLVDGILMLTGNKVRDPQGRPLRP